MGRGRRAAPSEIPGSEVPPSINRLHPTGIPRHPPPGPSSVISATCRRPSSHSSHLFPALLTICWHLLCRLQPLSDARPATFHHLFPTSLATPFRLLPPLSHTLCHPSHLYSWYGFSRHPSHLSHALCHLPPATHPVASSSATQQYALSQRSLATTTTTTTTLRSSV